MSGLRVIQGGRIDLHDKIVREAKALQRCPRCRAGVRQVFVKSRFVKGRWRSGYPAGYECRECGWSR